MRSILLLAIFLLLPRVGFSAVEKPLEFYVVHYPPYEIIDISGEIYGIDVDVAKAAFAAVGIPIEVKTAPWKRILKNIEYGRISGTITCSKRPGRELYMDYSDPISQAQQAVFSAVSTPVPSLKQFSDIADYTVTVVDGWGIQKELDIAGIDHLPTVDVASGINAIVYRDVELFYSGYLTTQYQAKQMGLEDQIKVSFLEGRGKTDFHVCFSKSYSDSRDLKQLFNKGLAIIKENGVFDAIYQRYVHMEQSIR
ncbi:MAG: transporter substrate-binding domain-containing protein [Neptuniibacter sp.]